MVEHELNCPVTVMDGQQFNTKHALSCRIGGIIIKRYNEVRDTLVNIMEQTWGNRLIPKRTINL